MSVHCSCHVVEQYGSDLAKYKPNGIFFLPYVKVEQLVFGEVLMYFVKIY